LKATRMPFAFSQDVPIGADVYASIVKHLGPEPLAGLIVHLVIRKDDGMLRYIDVWETEAACDLAFSTRIHPAVGAAFREHQFRPDAEPPFVPLDLIEVLTAAR
jgi:hypothetical protein